MSIKVCKFGGTSLADASQCLKVKAIIQSDPSRRYIVPSAPGKRSADDVKITDLLFRCRAAAEKSASFDNAFDPIKERFTQIAAELGLTEKIGPTLDAALAKIKTDIAAGATADYTASRGEFLNSLIIAPMLGDIHGDPYVAIDAADVIAFDAEGRLDTEKTQTLLSDRLRHTERAVIPGYYGAAPDGSIRTFTRGGSDITGALVARGVHADIYENWTDVSGMRRADPRVIDNPAPIEMLTYRELRELAYMGASVLHDEAVFPARAAGIPVNIRNTNAPDAPGTLIIPDKQTDKQTDQQTDQQTDHTDHTDHTRNADHARNTDHPSQADHADHPHHPRHADPHHADPHQADHPHHADLHKNTGTITGIAGRKDFTVFAIEKALMNNEIGFGRRVLSVFESHGVSYEHAPSGIDTMSIVVSDSELDGKIDALKADLQRECNPDRLAVLPAMALIATVGRGMAHTPGMAAKLFTALATAKVNIRMIDQGSSEMNIIVGVETSDFERAVSAIYDAFVTD